LFRHEAGADGCALSALLGAGSSLFDVGVGVVCWSVSVVDEGSSVFVGGIAVADCSFGGISSSLELTARADSWSTEARVKSVVVGKGTFVTLGATEAWWPLSSSSNSRTSSS
jgi:hypothetical protein